MIKVCSGKYRSRILQTPDEGTLPTKNRVREAIFSALSTYIPGANVLDLFAGSGALGIEALSRGAKFATFVDKNPKAAAIVRANLSTLKETNAKVMAEDYISALDSFREPFDVVFLDPPYAMKDSYQMAIDYLLEYELLSEESAVMVEYEGELTLNTQAFSSRRDYTYGKTKVIILKK